ncbi:hypothetical protein EJ02DRAFT_396368 [Clathrospora elynae]|uniref:Uncharacterized protein n=1 Tax=Clathrospora elynae TaxID=706981 RepID=A0A6A5SXW2_9PLEO|nr:hypothetical protein EJ02DRAFT_396368 [Clathrospora elynae]
MTAQKGPCGHAQIGKIIEDMEQLLPSESIDRPDYRACRTTYGLLSTTFKRTADSNTPQKDYKELQALQKVLRHRLASLDPTRGLPRKFLGPLESLKSGIDDALTQGVTIDYLIRGVRDILEENPDATPAPKPAPVKMVSETRFKNVWDELQAEKDKNRKLNEENNVLAMKLREYERSKAMSSSSTGEPQSKKQRFCTEWIADVPSSN